MNLAQMKIELEDRRVVKAAEIAELVEVAKINQELTKMENPLYEARELAKVDGIKLDAIINIIAEQYAADDRKMSQVFGFGVIPNKILTVLKSIMFSKYTEKEELLMITGLDEQIIEETLDAFGNTAYFSKANIEIIEAQPMDIIKVKQLLEVIAMDMQLVSKLDFSKFNQTNVNYQYKRAQIRAEEMLENTLEYVAEAVDYQE